MKTFEMVSVRRTPLHAYIKANPVPKPFAFLKIFIDIFTKRFTIFIYKRNKESSFVQTEPFLLYKENPFSHRLSSLSKKTLAFSHSPMQFCNSQKMAEFSQKNCIFTKHLQKRKSLCKYAIYFCYASPTMLYFLHFLEIVDWSVCKISATFAPLLYFAIYCCNNFLS